jgi:dipeptidyl-peptidase-3
MSANRDSGGSFKYLRSEDLAPYRENMHIVRFVATVIHELLGHGTGKLSETSPGHFNFNAQDPPISPLTGVKMGHWYRPGETYSDIFEDIAQSVEKCRAILMSAYLTDDQELLGIFAYDENSDLAAGELMYLSYLHLGVKGMQSLEHYNPGEQTWS